MKKNKARCKNCGDIIESMFRHAWVCCRCFKDKPDGHGIFIDGGNDYWRMGGNFEDFERIDEDIPDKEVKDEV